MSNSTALRLAAVLGFLAVALGAFGAHSLNDVLQANQALGVWEKAVFYQFVHAVMLFVLGFRFSLARGPWWSFFAGIVLFSGSLYLLALTQVKWLGAVTPLGGLSFLAGWLWLALKPPLPSDTA
jgi:uncharacterized membrane protein YgdD (TMEM256/DUF423 family)